MIQKFTILTSLTLVMGCVTKEPTDPTTSVVEGEQNQEGPGSEAWGEEDITCSSNNDCLVGESCLNEVCQPTQCEGGLINSDAPMGSTFTFFGDNEIGIADSTLYNGAYWVDTFSPSATSASYENSTEFSASRLVDITGGRFEKVQKARYVAAVEGRRGARVLVGRGEPSW